MEGPVGQTMLAWMISAPLAVIWVRGSIHLPLIAAMPVLLWSVHPAFSGRAISVKWAQRQAAGIGLKWPRGQRFRRNTLPLSAAHPTEMG